MNDRGQTTVELVASAAALILTVSGTGWLLHAEWQRAKCAYLVFEQAHARLTGIWGENYVSTTGQCGESREHVRLNPLEKTIWE